MPANTSFPIGGTVYTRNGTTAASGGKVFVWAAKRPSEVTSVNIASDGTYSIDLGSLATQWATTEYFYVGAKDSTDNYEGLVRFSPGVNDQLFNGCNIYVKNKSFSIAESAANVTSFGAAVGGTALDFYLIERRTDKVMACVKPAANGVSVQTFNYPGVRCHYGYYVMRTAQAGAINAQGAGVANVVGDTATNALTSVTVAEG